MHESELAGNKIIGARAIVWKYFNRKSSAKRECKICFKNQAPIGSTSGLV
jgi:hypothetical protein